MPEYDECSIYDFECREGKCLHKKENEVEKQRVWRTYFETETCGFFVWDVMEVIGETHSDYPLISRFDKCRDGSYILIQCYQFWTKERALNFLSELSDERYQILYLVTGQSDMTMTEYMEWVSSDEPVVRKEPVTANPYARHDVQWDTEGSGVCHKIVARPDGKNHLCKELPQSPVHGGSQTTEYPDYYQELHGEVNGIRTIE